MYEKQHKNNAVLKENKKKRNQDRYDVCYVTFKYLFTYSRHMYM